MKQHNDNEGMQNLKTIDSLEKENYVCSFYVTDRLIEILELEDTNQKKLLKLLNEFKDEMIHNLGVNALHNNYGD